MSSVCKHGNYVGDNEGCDHCAGEGRQRIRELERIVAGADTYCACCGGSVALNNPKAMAEHVARCPTHPSHALVAEVTTLKAKVAELEAQLAAREPTGSQCFALPDRNAPRAPVRIAFPSADLNQKEPNLYVQAYSTESWGVEHRGMKLFLLLPRELNDNDQRAIDQCTDDLKKALEAESMRLDPEQIAWKAEWLQKVHECFAPFGCIFIEEIPNEYNSDNPHRVWLRVTTPVGHFKVGWRSHVIHLDWEKTSLPEFDPAPEDKVTKWERGIHCYGYGKLAEYVKVLAGLRTP